MREIKFRGKSIDTGEWVYGSLITGFFFKDGVDTPYIMTSEGTDYDCFEDIAEGNGIYEVDPESMGQYTGLKDVSGKEIYEGDIVCTEEYGFWEIKWNEENAQFIMDRSGELEEVEEFVDIMSVIGNIHDNEELLEEEE